MRAVPGFVYFVAPVCGGPIKIGHSGEPASRVKCLATWSPFDLEILAMAPGTTRDECAIHNLFHPSHLRNEWFKPSAALYALIEQVRARGELPAHCKGNENTKSIRFSGPRGPYKRDKKLRLVRAA